jgi:hypothetical protein
VFLFENCNYNFCAPHKNNDNNNDVNDNNNDESDNKSDNDGKNNMHTIDVLFAIFHPIINFYYFLHIIGNYPIIYDISINP